MRREEEEASPSEDNTPLTTLAMLSVKKCTPGAPPSSSWRQRLVGEEEERGARVRGKKTGRGKQDTNEGVQGEGRVRIQGIVQLDQERIRMLKMT